MKHFKLILNTSGENLDLIKGCTSIIDICTNDGNVCISYDPSQPCPDLGDQTPVCTGIDICYNDNDPTEGCCCESADIIDGCFPIDVCGVDSSCLNNDY